MKSMKLETKKIVDAYKILDNAKYQKLSDEDKVKLWKISRKLSPIAKKFTEEAEDAQKKLLPSEDFQDKLQKALLYEKMLKEDSKEEKPLSNEDYLKIVGDFKKYNQLVDSALKELYNKEETLEIELLSPDAFGKLMASNDWTLKQVAQLEFICDE